MTEEGVTIDISKYPRSEGVETDNKRGYYYESGNGKVDLTESYYPGLEGTYRKFIHTPESGNIQSITHNGKPLSGITSLGDHKSVSVYYWSQDIDHGKPLLIQLGEGINEYYTTDNGNTWINQSGIKKGNIRGSLNKQNCDRNKAHVVDLSYRSSTNYQCPGCQTQEIQVSYSGSSGDISYSTYTIRGSRSFSVTSFKDNSIWQAGLPSLKDLKETKVIWKNNSGNKPLLSVTPQNNTKRYFRKSADDGNAWIEVSNADAHPNGETPTIATLDLSKISGIKYNGDSDIGFEIFPDYCKSVTVYYWSGDGDYGNPLVVQLSGKDEKYYTDTGNWQEEEGINSDTLLATLDKFSCSLDTHIVDISQKSGQPYNCSACHQLKITLSSSLVNNKYTRVTHSPNRFVCRLKNSQDNITSIPITKEIDSVYVCLYPLTDGNPLLICLEPKNEEEEGIPSSYVWYQRDSPTGSKWTNVVASPPSSPDDSSTILKLLKTINGDKEGLTPGDIVGHVAKGLTGGGVGTEAQNFFFNPNWSATRQIIRLLTRLL